MIMEEFAINDVGRVEFKGNALSDNRNHVLNMARREIAIGELAKRVN